MDTFTYNPNRKRATKINSRSLLLTLGLILFTAGGAFAQTELYQQGFEDDDNLTTYTANVFRNNADAFYARMRYDSSDLKYTPDEYEGEFIWVTGRVTVPENTNDPEGVLVIEDIPISEYGDLHLKMLIGAAQNQFEEDSYMLIEARIDSDNDADYKIIGAFYGDDDIVLGPDEDTTKELRQDTDLSGDDDGDAPELGNIFAEFNFPISGINGLSTGGDLLDIRIITTNNDATGTQGEEQTSFDDIRVYGTNNLTNGAPVASVNTTAINEATADTVMTFDIEAPGKHIDFTTLTFNLDISEITDWSHVIGGAQLSDGTNTITNSSISTNSIDFTGIPTGGSDLGHVNNETKNYTLKIWFKDNTNDHSIDGENIIIDFDQSDFTVVNNDPIFGSISNGTGTPIQVDATQIVFTDVPTAVQTSMAFSATIEAQDGLGYIDINDVSSITLSQDDDPDPGVLASAGLAQNLIAGTSTWNDLTWDGVEGTVFQIDATDGGPLIEVTSGDITVPDNTPPADFQTGAVITTGAPIVAGYLNASNTGVNITIPIADDASLNGGELQIRAKINDGSFQDLVNVFNIDNVDQNKTVNIPAADLEGLTDFGEGVMITFNAIIYDASSNSTPGTASTTTLTVDQDLPDGFQTGAVVTTGAPVVAGYWNDSNTGVDITVPIANDASLNGGELQIRAKINNGSFQDLGSSDGIDAIGSNKTMNFTAGDLEGLTGFTDGVEITFNAIITDIAGNSTTGTPSETTLTVDQDPPTGFSITDLNLVGGNVNNGQWDITNNEIAIKIPIANDASLNGGNVQIIAKVVGTDPFHNLGDPFTIDAINTQKAVSVTEAQFEGLSGYAEGAQITFSAIITDIAGNSTEGTSGIELIISVEFTTGDVVTTGGNVVAGYWNESNTGVNVTVPVPDYNPFSGGDITIEAKSGDNDFSILAQDIDVVAIDADQIVSISKSELEMFLDFEEGSVITFNAIIRDDESVSFFGTPSSTTLTVDQELPTNFQTGTVATIGGNEFAGYWNSTNTAVDITVPIANDDASLIGGDLQIIAKVTGQPDFVPLGSSESIDAIGSKIMNFNAGQLEALNGGLTDGSVITFSAIITDKAGNSTTGTASATTLRVDQSSPTPFSIDNVTATENTVVSGYWNSTNEGVDITVPIAGDASLNGGELQIIADVGGGTFVVFGDVITIDPDDIDKNKTVSFTASTLEGLDNFDEDSVITFNAIITDISGNPPTSGTLSADTLKVDQIIPIVSPNEISFISGSELTFTINEKINLDSPDETTGFTTSDGNLSDQIYSLKDTSNVVTLSGSGWSTDNSTVSYDAGSGNIEDLAGNRMASFSGYPVVKNIVNMSPGDVAFTYYSEDNYEFAFVILKDIPAGTQIKFTDNGWNETTKSFRTPEKTLIWQADVDYYAGLEVIIYNGNTDPSEGTVIGSGLNLSANGKGDQIFAYQGTSINPILLGGIHNNINNNNDDGWNNDNDNQQQSMQPGQLNTTPPSSFVLSPEEDNAVYNRTLTEGTVAEVLNAINNSNNWDNNNNLNNIADPTEGLTSYVLPPSVSSLVPTGPITTDDNIITLQIAFNENITKSTVFDGKITISGDNNIAYTINLSEISPIVNSNIVNINLPAALSDGIYEVDVDGFLFKNADENHNTPIVGDTDWKFTVDATPPAVSSIVRGADTPKNPSNGTSASSVTFDVTFSEIVTGVEITDFVPMGPASEGGGTATVSGISGSGDTYTLTVSSIDKLGDLTIDFTGAISDLGGNIGSGYIDNAPENQSFIIINPEPSEHPTALLVNPVADSYTLNLSWTPGAGPQLADGYLILYKAAAENSFLADPIDLFEQSDSFGSAKGVVNSEDESINISGLASATQYDFKIYPYTNSGTHIDYKTDIPVDNPILTGSGATSFSTKTKIDFVSANSTISSVNNTPISVADEDGHFVFIITDDKDDNGADNSPTLIKEIVIRKGSGNNQIGDWSQAIAGAELSDGTNTMTQSAFDGTSITFSTIDNNIGNLGHITDNEAKTYTLKIWLKEILGGNLNEIIDQRHFVFDVHEDDIQVENLGTSGFFQDQQINSEPDNNMVEVRATKFVMTQKASVEGVDQPISLPLPIIGVTDNNDNRDLNYSTDENGGTFDLTRLDNNDPEGYSGILSEFGNNSFLDMSGFQYTSTGNGKLHIEGVNGAGIPMMSAESTADSVEVMNTHLSFYDIAAFTPQGTSTLQTAAKDMTIIGFKLKAGSNGTEPDFENITINFKDGTNNPKDISDIFENIRIYKVYDEFVESAEIDVHYSQVDGSGVNEGLSSSTSVVIDGFSEKLNIQDADTSYYVIVTDIKPTANETSGTIKVTITPSTGYLAENNGNMTDPTSTIEGKLFNFIDYAAPNIILTNPVNGSISASYETTVFSFTFDEPVTYIGAKFFDNPDPDIELRKFVGDTLVAYDSVSLIIDNDKSFAISFWEYTADDTIKIELAQSEQYYILIAANQFEDNSNNQNKHTGFTDKGFWSFTTTDTSPPKFIFEVDSSELIAHTYDIGFDIKVKLDEPGTAYALAIPDTDMIDPNLNPDPTSFDEIKTKGDSVEITSSHKDFYIPIRNLGNNTYYKIFVAAEDLGGNQQLIVIDNPSASDVQKLIRKTAPFDDLVSDPDIEICVGEFQDITVPITLIEGSDDDFQAGTFDLILPNHYVFDTLAVADTATVINDDFDIKIEKFWYRNPSTLAVNITNSGIVHKDEIRITGLRIQALPEAANGTMVITGDITGAGTNHIPYADSAANMMVSNLPKALFKLFPEGDFINANIEVPIALTQDEPVDKFLGESYLFEGNGVNKDSLFVNLAPLGKNIISLTQTFGGGCQAFGSDTVTITDVQIVGLAFKYCGNSGSVKIPEELKVDDPDNPFGANYILETLTASVDEIPDPIKADIASWNADDFVFNPGSAIPEGSTAEYVSIEFEGLYKNKINANDVIPITQTVRIYPVPTVSITHNNDTTDFAACEDEGDLTFIGSPIPNGVNITGVYKLTKISSNVGLDSLITTNLDGSAIINTQTLKNSPFGGSGDYMVSYEHTNSNSTCVVTAEMMLTINPKPIANFDIGGSLNGCEDTSITFNNTTQIDDSFELAGATFEWNFDDADNSTDNSSTDQTPTHTFVMAGTYNVSLTTTTTGAGCISVPAEEEVIIGNNPIPDFTYRQIGTDLPTRFANTTGGLDSTSKADSVVVVTWEYEAAGTTFTLDNDSIREVLDDVAHTYSAPGVKEVTMTATTFNGCERSVTTPIFVVPVIALDQFNGQYEQDFENSNGDWVPWGKEKFDVNSWTTAPVTGGIITGDSKFWVTGTAAYNTERSYIYSPIFDISSLERPLIAFDNMMDMRSGFDGVYLEYQTYDISSNVSWNGGEWIPVGNVNTGIDWYGAENILNFNNENLSNNLKDYGWSEVYTDWKNSRHSLADIPVDERERVQFRFSFIAGNGNLELGTPHEGFAFDDFEIGERTRSVLVENFTNTSKTELVKEENDYLNNTFASGDTKGIEVVKINYHTDFPGADPVNKINPTDHGARVAYYDIAAIPQVVLDGDTTRTYPHLFSEWGEGAFGQRSLSLAEFDITISPDINPTTGLMEIEVIATPFASLSRPENDVILHVALIQDSVTVTGVNSGETVLYDMVRDMLPNAAGTLIPYSETLNQFTRTFTWTPTGEYDPAMQSPVEVFDLDLMSIVVFIQDEKEKIVYQAALLRSYNPLLNTLDIQHVTGLEGLEETGFALYPNPATDQTMIAFGRSIEDEYQLKMYDRFGKLLYEQAVVRGTRTIVFDTKPYINGLYFIKVESSDKVIAHKKLIIMK